MVVSHPSDHKFSAAVAKFHCHSVKILVYLVYLAHMAVPSPATSVIFSLMIFMYTRSLQIPFSVGSQIQRAFKCPGMTPVVINLVGNLPGLFPAVMFPWFYYCF